MHYLTLDLSDNAEGVTTVEAMASTRAEHHAAVLAEVGQLLGWAWRAFPHSHGPVDEGGDWDHDLQVQVEEGGWHSVTLTLSGSPAFADAFVRAFGSLLD